MPNPFKNYGIKLIKIILKKKFFSTFGQSYNMLIFFVTVDVVHPVCFFFPFFEPARDRSFHILFFILRLTFELEFAFEYLAKKEFLIWTGMIRVMLLQESIIKVPLYMSLLIIDFG